MVFASGSDLESANPLVTIHPLARQVQRHVLFVTLFRYDSALGISPYFARTATWSTDRRELAMILHAGLRWHDGRPTTARDAAFTIDAARDARTGFARATDLAQIARVRATSDTTLYLDFEVPQRAIPAVLAELPIVPEHLLRAVDPTEMRRHEFSTAPTGNGPFRFVERVAGQSWTFERNDEFPKALGGAPAIRRLVIAVVDEATTKFAGLASGDLDFAGIAPTMAELAERDPAIDVVSYPVLFTNVLVFNSRKAPFADARVRRAFSLSVDRQRIVDAALAGYGTPASGPVVAENPLSGGTGVTFDAAAADSLFDAAGYRRNPGGRRDIDVELLTVGSGDNAVEQLIQADLADRGVSLRIRQMELAAFLARARSRVRDFDLLVTGIPGDLALSHIRAMFAPELAGGSLDYAGFRNARLDSAFASVRAARTEAELRHAWVAIQDILSEEMPVAWLHHSRGVQGVSARMRHVRMDLRGELVSVSRWTTDGTTTRTVSEQR